MLLQQTVREVHGAVGGAGAAHDLLRVFPGVVFVVVVVVVAAAAAAAAAAVVVVVVAFAAQPLSFSLLCRKKIGNGMVMSRKIEYGAGGRGGGWRVWYLSAFLSPSTRGLQ